MVEYSENVGIAFAVVFAAGLSTAVGASVVFFPSLIQYANRRTLAAGLGLSSGVMVYVSFVEIFIKSVDSFASADFLDHQAYLAATLCFFAGIVLMICLNLVIHGVASHNLLTSGGGSDDDDDDSDDEFMDEDSIPSKRSGTSRAPLNNNNNDDDDLSHTETAALIDSGTPCLCSGDPVEKLEHIQEMAKRSADIHDHSHRSHTDGENQQSQTDVIEFSDETGDVEQGLANDNDSKRKHKNPSSTASTSSKGSHKEPSGKDKRKLTMMSLNTAVAIALHNFPEGLATFVATLQDPAVGAVLAVAIAIHNIPEGLCVAMPVYYATGNRWRAFSWGLLSGISEPIAAFFGWLVLASWINDIVYAVLFGMVSGMMIVISVKELLPTAHRYDPEDAVVTNCFITGMAIMALSLVLFAQL
ncbi:Zinc transporter ZupT [Seminavis robusta]|uniref:Zinc transporter ZupT n=1 Tax=Seminavis robusta TaxID=568900 RepID=A0A9N8HWM4_9STRA|nr:Zinc transporter ZupT [Seminavis robusta]|eukprot:Sro2217_g319480.1 Zinc transporter ZupT (415) ;mRNA; f:6802-8286